jgi:hypothetical protein
MSSAAAVCHSSEPKVLVDPAEAFMFAAAVTINLAVMAG